MPNGTVCYLGLPSTVQLWGFYLNTSNTVPGLQDAKPIVPPYKHKSHKMTRLPIIADVVACVRSEEAKGSEGGRE